MIEIVHHSKSLESCVLDLLLVLQRTGSGLDRRAGDPPELLGVANF